MSSRVARKSVQAVSGEDYVVVSGHRTATDAALEIMRNRGNIVDAAIAGAAVLCAALPHACGLGGDCFALLHYEGKTQSLNGSGRSPGRLPRDVSPDQLSSGPLSCSVPGMLGGWEALHRRHGALPWGELFHFAIDLARHGVAVSDDLAKALEAHREALRTDPGCRRIFLAPENDSGSSRLLRQPGLAGSLEAVARRGAKAFYTDEIGRRLCQALAGRGGVLEMDDLAAYQPIWTEPLRYRYRGLDICVPPPNSYAMLLLLQLAALSSVSLDAYAYGSPERLAFLMKAAQLAIAEGAPLLADPQCVEAVHSELPPPALVGRLERALIAPEEPGRRQDLPPSHGTALISVADRRGNGITIIQSIFTPFGSHVGDDQTGVVLNNRLLGFSTDPAAANAAAPARRPAHTLSPALVLEGGRLRYLLSTPGGSGQTITLAQVLTGMVDYGQPLEDSIGSPRWSLDLQGNLLAEPEITSRVVDAIRASGLPVHTAESRHRFFFGSAECIHVGEEMELKAVADYRRDAWAGGY